MIEEGDWEQAGTLTTIMRKSNSKDKREEILRTVRQELDTRSNWAGKRRIKIMGCTITKKR